MMTVAVVGAGMAGLICGRVLQGAGYDVTWFEKSRGVGGRLATRRLASGGWVDHGVRYWADQGGLQALTKELLTQGVLHEWSAQGFVWADGLTPNPGIVYCGDRGVNAIAKHLAHGCDIRRQHRVSALSKTASGWQLIADSPDGPIKFQADAVVLAVPAPQVLPLLQPLDAGAATALASVDYAPCLSLMATYKTLPEVPLLNHGLGWHITAEHPVLSWLSLDSSKRLSHSAPPVMLMQSQARFAAQYLRRLDALGPAQVEPLLNETATQMLTAAAAIVPGLDQPQNYRLHRWRYSVVSQPHGDTLFKTQWPSLVCCGDWCTTDDMANLEAAHRSGMAAAALIKAS